MPVMPSWMLKLTSSSATTSLYRLVRCDAEISASLFVWIMMLPASAWCTLPSIRACRSDSSAPSHVRDCGRYLHLSRTFLQRGSMLRRDCPHMLRDRGEPLDRNHVLHHCLSLQPLRGESTPPSRGGRMPF